MSPIRPRALLSLAVAAMLLAGCIASGDGGLSGSPQPLPNISMAGSPNSTKIGRVDQNVERVVIRPEGRAVVAAFRATGCAEPAPDFERLMRRQVQDGLRVPTGITLYDAGIGRYRSSRCNASVPARAIGVYAYKRGTYRLEFFGGRTVRTVVVR